MLLAARTAEPRENPRDVVHTPRFDLNRLRYATLQEPRTAMDRETLADLIIAPLSYVTRLLRCRTKQSPPSR